MKNLRDNLKGYKVAKLLKKKQDKEKRKEKKKSKGVYSYLVDS